MGIGPKFPARPDPQIFLFGSAGPGINALQNFYKSLMCTLDLFS